MLSCNALHFGEKLPQCPGVQSGTPAAAADETGETRRGLFHFGCMEDLGKNSVELRPNSTRIHSDANFGQDEFVLGGNKEFVHEREDLEQGRGSPTLGFCRAGAQRDDPSCRVVAW